MTEFGDPKAVLAAADSLRTASTLMEGAHSLIKQAQPEIWEGAAADAFTDAARKTLSPAVQLGDALLAASGTLTRYAAAQREAQGSYEHAQADYDRAANALRSNPLDVPAAFTLVQSRLGAFGALGQLQQAASVAASELRAASGADGDARPWWDPFGWFNDEENPDERVSDNIMDDDAFDPDDVSQGGINDCFMLAAIVSLLNTDEGDQFIRDNIRWDPDKEGYWVTLYSGGEPKEVFVDYVYGQGAKQNDWEWLIFSGDKPSIAALYEAAISQENSYWDLDGGVTADAMELITGKPATTIAYGRHVSLNPSDYEHMREVLNNGGQVALSSPVSGDHHIMVSDADGHTRGVDIVTGHAYSVTHIDSEGGVWVRNPWGTGNSADGGGEFRIDADDAEELFWRASLSNITE